MLRKIEELEKGKSLTLPSVHPSTSAENLVVCTRQSVRHTPVEAPVEEVAQRASERPVLRF
jgi:hypothetical protein